MLGLDVGGTGLFGKAIDLGPELRQAGALVHGQREQRYPIKMTAGATYVIDMESPQFDTLLRLEDDQGKIVAENDDISPTNQNSRIFFIPRENSTYRIVATSFQQRGIGAYTITVREFATQKK